MKKTMLLMLNLILAVVLLTACSSKSGASSTNAITKEKNGQTITVTQGNTFVVSLPGNMTTGYSWAVKEADAGVVVQEGEPVAQPESDKIGAGGLIELKFKAVAPGRTTLKLIYYRSFEKETPPLDTFEITVEVK
jgi:inhibitor of cysteine peptidase